MFQRRYLECEDAATADHLICPQSNPQVDALEGWSPAAFSLCSCCCCFWQGRRTPEQQLSVTAAPNAAFSEVSVMGQAGRHSGTLDMRVDTSSLWTRSGSPITGWTVTISCSFAINHFTVLLQSFLLKLFHLFIYFF